MFSVTSMDTYSKYFVYGGAYYVWVNERTLLSSSLWIYIYIFFRGVWGRERGGGGGGLQSKVGYFLKR